MMKQTCWFYDVGTYKMESDASLLNSNLISMSPLTSFTYTDCINRMNLKMFLTILIEKYLKIKRLIDRALNVNRAN
uniref:Uncharacterized protein n=1 Tax=Schistosoma haematobium TaxID=6185 RepID=A0A095A3P8_SCHHA